MAGPDLFRPGNITSGLQAYWKLNNLPEIECVDAPTNEDVSTTYSSGYGQTFTTSGSFDLEYIHLTMSKVGSPSGTARVAIYATSGGLPTGSALATTATFNCTDIVNTVAYTSANYEKFQLSSAYTLSGSTMYAVVVEPVSAWSSHDASNRLRFFRSASGTYSGGTTVKNSGSWATGSGEDMGFQLYGSDNPPPTIDSSGNGNHLNDNGTVGAVSHDYWKTGEGSADFELSNNEYLSISDGSQTGLDITGSYSISAWIKPESLATTQYILSKGGAFGNGYAFSYAGALRAYIDTTEYATTSSTVVAVGKWNHVAVSFDADADTISIYCDGNLVQTWATATGVPTDVATQFQLSGNNGTTQCVDGLMKDVAVWNVALTPLQIKSLALGVDLSIYAYRPDSVSTAPTAWWKLNELSGNRADSIDGLTLTDNGGTLASKGYTEGVGLLGATNDYLTHAGDAKFAFGTGDFSISCWVNPRGTNSVWRFFDVGGYSDGHNYAFYSTGTTAGNLTLYTGGSSLKSYTTAITNVDQWFHFCFIRTSGTVRLYIDGIQNGTDLSDSTDISDNNFWFNAWQTQLTEGLVGSFQDLAIWKGYALSTAEIASLACGIPLQQTGIVSYWKLDETSGNRADSIGSNTLTDNNTVLSGTGKVSNAADFERDNSESLSITDASQSGLDLTDDFTLLCWFKPESAASNTLLGKDNQGSGYGIRTNTSSQFTLSVRGVNLASSTTISTGTWYHGVGIWEGANRYIYLNSAQENTSATTVAPLDTAVAFIIGYDATSTHYMDGLIDEALVAKRWFRVEEIKTIYCKGLNGKEVTSGEIHLGGNQIIWFI